jgi:outer membrane protein TolC
MGLEALVPYLGATASLVYESGDETTNNVTARFSPALTSRLVLAGEVPLMRGLIWNAPWTQVRTTKLGANAADSDFETSVMNTVQGIVNSYWKLVATKEQLRVAETALETANALLDQTQTQYDVGVVSKVDVVEAEAGVANRQFEKIVARNAYQNANDELIATLLGRRLRAGTTIVFAPTDNPSFEATSYVDVESLVAEAFEKRPELKSFEDRIEQAKIQEKFARNQRLPEVNFTGSYATQGLSGDAVLGGGSIPLPPPPPSGNYGDTFDTWFDRRVWSAGARVSIPIPNTTARKNVNKAEFELRRAESRRTQFKQSIIVDIRAAARGLIASAEGVEAAERGRVAAAEQLRAERIRLEHGESTPFDVLQRQNDLVSAESRKVAALQTYRDSQAALDRARGSILEVYNVQITQVRQLD